MAQYISNTTQNKKLDMSVFGNQKSGLMSQIPTPQTSNAVWGIPQVKNQIPVTFPGTNKTSTAPMMLPKTSAPAPTSGYAPLPQSSGGVPQNYGGAQSSGYSPNVSPTGVSTPIRGMVSPTVPTPMPASQGQMTPFGGLVKDITDTAKPNKTQKGLVSDISDTAKGNINIGLDARAIADKYGAEINRIGQLGAGAVAGNLSTGTNVVGSGNAAIASQSASARIEALSNALNAELAGTQQQLTGQGQAATGLNFALGGANTQQQQQISGLTSAAGYAQPNVAGYGQTVFDPLTGTYGGGAPGLDPQNVAMQLANEVRTGRMTYDQAVASLGYSGAGQQFLNSALQGGGGFNIPASQAQLQGQTGVLSQIPYMESADVAAEGIKGKITTYLAANPQLNPSVLAAGNLLQQWIQGKQLTDPKYQTLFNYLNEYTNTLAPVLGVGGDPTNLKTQIAQSFVNAAASGQSIAQVLDSISALSKGKIQDLRSGATGGGVVSSPQAGSGTGSGGLYDW